MSFGVKATNTDPCVTPDMNGCMAPDMNRCVAPLRLSNGLVPFDLSASCLAACNRLAHTISYARTCIQDRALKVLPRGQLGVHAGMQGGTNT